MPDEKPKFRLGDDGELDDESTQPIQKMKRKAKPRAERVRFSTLTVIGFAALLTLIGCLLIANLVNNRLARLPPTPIVIVATVTPQPPTPTRSSPTPTPTRPPTATPAPTLVITPATIGIGERPFCWQMPVTGNERIVFDTTYGDGNREIYVLDLSLPQDNNICRLTDNTAEDTSPVWHPAGSSVLFNRDGALWTVNLDGSNLTPLGVNGTDAQWDRDGTWIVYISAESSNVEVISPSLAFQRPVNALPAWDEFEPDCCSLAQFPNFINLMPRVVFAAAPRAGERAGTSDANAREIYAVNADGSGRDPLTNNDEYDDEPDWSPGGNQIVFTRGRYGFNTDIWIMNANGANPIRLTDSEATDHHPRWLPDGRIMFVSQREQAGAIYVMYADGSSVSPITAPLRVLSFDFWTAR